jgi:hypothetical protein
VARALAVVWAKLATVRARTLADARAWALPDSTTFSNDSIVYEIALGLDGALRPREVPPRDHTSDLPPPPGTHRGKARARGAWPPGKLQAGGDGCGGGGGGGKAWGTPQTTCGTGSAPTMVVVVVARRRGPTSTPLRTRGTRSTPTTFQRPKYPLKTLDCAQLRSEDVSKHVSTYADMFTPWLSAVNVTKSKKCAYW